LNATTLSFTAPIYCLCSANVLFTPALNCMYLRCSIINNERAWKATCGEIK
jgi:hypothetical protein